MTTAAPGYLGVHAHFVTDSYVRRARAAGHELPDGVPAWPTWSAAAHLELMDRCGVETSILSISSPGIHFGLLPGHPLRRRRRSPPAGP
ncbi:hypothetical protein [Streptomyces mutabilis]|uniref:Amidohydrolase n=1 Tax=Streptomyces mutabilis TaxID=67332 RepID=A0A086N8C5_9ACTN|nr:hypothetical protein [Streptomyces mutabilis]KFG77393.1 hypothetical protein FM21_15570 [Streptomyces mutabilis]